MLDQIPEVKAANPADPQSVTVTVGNRQFPETVDVVDPNFLQVIKLPLVAGDPRTVFAQPDSVVLSESAARKYFGDAIRLGKTIVVSAEYCDELARIARCSSSLLTSPACCGTCRTTPSWRRIW